MSIKLLREKKASVLLIEQRKNTDVIVTAPHHTIGGVKNMPCLEHTAGDENTGLIAREIAKKLKASSIIACNYRIDPNKDLSTDYSCQIIKWNPKYLIEIHGHGAVRIDDSLIEISSGKLERNHISILFSEILKTKLQKFAALNKYEVNGDFSKIHFKARNTVTITDNRWIPIHIELPPSIRLDGANKLPHSIFDFYNCLTATIIETCK